MNKTTPSQPTIPAPTVTIATQDAAFAVSLMLSVAHDLGHRDALGREIRRVAARIVRRSTRLP